MLMRGPLKVLLLALALPQHGVVAQRAPTWADWEAVKEHTFQLIIDSTCPNAGDEALKTHWDYDYQGFLDSGMTEEEALNQDCNHFHRFRNPGPLGSRLIRHAFHDAAGGFNGFVNKHDLIENPGLGATMEILRDEYNTLEVPNGDNGETIKIRRLITFADFTAWACHAALLRAVNLQNVSVQQEGRDIENEPPVAVRYGRPTYEPINEQDEGPTEYFPTGLGAQGTGQLIVDYFAEQFGFTPQEVVTVMGAHTLGGARREDSGFAGMWTQSKGKFNNDWQKQVVFPLPMICYNPNNCEYYSQAGDNIMAPWEDKKTCVEEGRCFGWQQTRRAGIDDRPNKYQWMHSCDENGDGCTHLMLNIDLGLFYDLEGYICTAEDEANQVPATAGRNCEEGMIKGYPEGSPCSLEDTRVLATCFNPNQETNSYMETDANDMEQWVQNFGPLFDALLTHNMDGAAVADLSVLEPPQEEEATVRCRNDRTWTTTLENGSTRPCNYVGLDPEARCNDILGDDGVPAYEACCAACEGVAGVNRGEADFNLEGSNDMELSPGQTFHSESFYSGSNQGVFHRTAPLLAVAICLWHFFLFSSI